MSRYRIVSADAHILEPPHIWETWLPKALQDKAPKLAKDVDGGDAWQFAGSPDPGAAVRTVVESLTTLKTVRGVQLFIEGQPYADGKVFGRTAINQE